MVGFEIIRDSLERELDYTKAIAILKSTEGTYYTIDLYRYLKQKTPTTTIVVDAKIIALVTLTTTSNGESGIFIQAIVDALNKTRKEVLGHD